MRVYVVRIKNVLKIEIHIEIVKQWDIQQVKNEINQKNLVNQINTKIKTYVKLNII
jgi:hypothetical protein